MVLQRYVCWAHTTTTILLLVMKMSKSLTYRQVIRVPPGGLEGGGVPQLGQGLTPLAVLGLGWRPGLESGLGVLPPPTKPLGGGG